MKNDLKKAVVLGGTHDHIRLISLLKNAGFYVYLIDYYQNPIAKNFADEHLVGSTLDADFVLTTCRELNVQLCIACCIDQALVTMAYVSEKLGLPSHISYETALSLTNKILMKEKFVMNEIPTSKHLYLKNNIENFSAEGLQYPLVVKPSDGNSSKGIQKINTTDQLQEAIEYAFEISTKKEVVVEEFKEGIELSVDVLVLDYQPIFVNITENVKRRDTPEKFTIVKNVYNNDIQNKYSERIKEIAVNIAKAYQLPNTPLLIQLLAKDEELNVIEFSARIGGGSKHHFIKTITGVDMLQNFVDIVLDNKLSLSSEKTEFYAYASMNYIYTIPGTVHKYEGVDILKSENIIVESVEYKPIGSSITNSSTSTDRPLGLMITAQTLDELKDKTTKVDNTLKILNEKGDDIMIHNLLDYSNEL